MLNDKELNDIINKDTGGACKLVDLKRKDINEFESIKLTIICDDYVDVYSLENMFKDIKKHGNLLFDELDIRISPVYDMKLKKQYPWESFMIRINALKEKEK